MGEVFFFKNYHFATGFQGRVEFFFFAAFGCDFFPPPSGLSEVIVYSQKQVKFFIFQKTSMPPPNIKWCAPLGIESQ